jgi:hypothetical protein
MHFVRGPNSNSSTSVSPAPINQYSISIYEYFGLILICKGFEFRKSAKLRQQFFGDFFLLEFRKSAKLREQFFGDGFFLLLLPTTKHENVDEFR